MPMTIKNSSDRQFIFREYRKMDYQERNAHSDDARKKKLLEPINANGKIICVTDEWVLRYLWP